MHILKWIPPRANLIVEFGCGDGGFGEKFKQIHPQCKYIGVETDVKTAMLAATKLNQVLVEDISQINLLKNGIFLNAIDCFIYRGIDDWGNTTLEGIVRNSEFLREDGQIILNVPNESYIRNIVELFSGRGEYKQILPIEKIKSALESAGLLVYDIMAYTDKADEAFIQNEQIVQGIHLLAETFDREIDMKTIWHKGYILRVTKRKKPLQPLLLQSMLGEVKVCARVRIVEPHGFCETIPGVKVVNKAFSADLTVGDAYQRKVFIRQRIWSDLPKAAEELKTLVSRGYLVVSEMDDDPQRWEEHQKNDFFAFRGCHAVQASTPELAEYLRQFNPNVAVFPNQLAVLPPKRMHSNTDMVNLVFGALNREDDWQDLMPVLNEVLTTHKNRIRVRVIYDKKFFDRLHIENKEFIPFCPYPVYNQILHSSDIALLPLLDNRFNRMKSDLKFIECASHGVAVLASPTVYKETIKPGMTGLVYHDIDEFRRCLMELIENEMFRCDISDNAYRYVRDYRLLSDHYEVRYNWYSQLVDNLPRLNQELFKRNKELW